MVSAPPTADLLATILAATRRAVEVRRDREPLAALEKRADDRSRPIKGFLAAVQAGTVNVIAECKRRSPSRGVLRADYNAAAIAAGYERAGAAAVSVLTEPAFFDGALAHLEAVAQAIEIPVLRKDFVISEYQLLEARAAGADAVLLIVAALGRDTLRALMRRTADLGLASLVEVHQEAELQSALDAGARLIGINNRNLRTLDVDLHASERLIRRIPGDVVAISESGLRSPDDVRRLQQLGYRAFLVGEQFMSSPDPGRELRRLLDACGGASSGDSP
jgi:indole-3-glycerol phosphate synthase